MSLVIKCVLLSIVNIDLDIPYLDHEKPFNDNIKSK